MVQKTQFVCQEHRAKSLHWDFRIKRNGVLVSWAVPKHRFPEKGETLLAVQTPDHSLSWGNFEGDIKEGYGKGHVKIYDRGECIIEKWTDLSIHFELKGTKLKGRYVLVHIGNEDSTAWLILRSK